MSRLIDGDALLDYLQMLPIDLGYREVDEIEEYVKGMPTIEERKTGEWLLHTYMPYKNYCSCCKKDSPYGKLWDFCPNCGAKMEETE